MLACDVLRQRVTCCTLSTAMPRLAPLILVVAAGCSTVHMDHAATGVSASTTHESSSPTQINVTMTVDAAPDQPAAVTFATTELSAEFLAEGAAIGDLNNDGAPDLVAGAVWYEGPTFTQRHELAEAVVFDTDTYSEFFLTFVDDVNRDGALDVIAIAALNGVMGTGEANTHWYENPGVGALDQKWTKNVVFDVAVANESPIFADVTGDGVAELVFMTNQVLGYAARTDVATEPWVFTAVSDALFATPYVHGLGVGDVNGDGLADIVEKSGWWEQRPEGQAWVRHPVDFSLGGQGGAQMPVFDVDGDGDADVVTSLNAHGYGLAWFEQMSPDVFVPHEILSQQAAAENVSQLHALVAADINADGLTDVVTGKRYFAHPSSRPDPGTSDPPMVLWFSLNRDPSPAFIPHVVHDDSGVGCSFMASDVNADGKVDVFTTNKRGTFLHLQE